MKKNKIIIFGGSGFVGSHVADKLSDLGYSIMPLIGIKNELQNQQLEIIPHQDLPIITHWQLIWLKDKKHSPVAKRFLEFIEKEKEEIIAKQFDWYEKY